MVRSLQHPYTAWQITKAKRRYRKKHPECEITGLKASFWGRNNSVHHEFPVHLFPALALDERYFHTFVRDIHFVFAHLKNWNDYNINLKETIEKAREAYQKYGKSFLKENKNEIN